MYVQLRKFPRTTLISAPDPKRELAKLRCSLNNYYN